MKKLTFSTMAAARLRANKRGYLSLVIGVFLSIFLITTFVLGVYGMYNAQLWNRRDMVGNAEMVVLDNEIITDEKLVELGIYDQLGHAYVTGSIEKTSLYLGYYDTIGTEVIYEAVCETVRDFRASRPMSGNWKRRVDEDFKKRGR